MQLASPQEIDAIFSAITAINALGCCGRVLRTQKVGCDSYTFGVYE
jgi:hypothetical protein